MSEAVSHVSDELNSLIVAIYAEMRQQACLPSSQECHSGRPAITRDLGGRE